MIPGTASDWDKEFVGLGSVIYYNGNYHMWYTGGTSILSIGHAVSPDGLIWTKDASNPVLIRGSIQSWDENGVGCPGLMVINDTLHMWYTGQRGTNMSFDFQIGYATSTNGSNWTKSTYNPVMSTGVSGTWDSKWVAPLSAIDSSGVKYKMWYMGSNADETSSIGYAESINTTDVFNIQSENNISVYPNPAADIINLEISNTGEQEIEIEILTVSGQVVYSQQYKNSRDSFVQQIDLSGYAKGVYFVRIRQTGALYNGKIVVM